MFNDQHKCHMHFPKWKSSFHETFRIPALALLLFITFSASAQERIISGKVNGQDDGLPLPGVNVVVKGANVGTVTDANGNYSLSIPNAGAILQFSFVGFMTQEVETGQRSALEIVLILEVKQLSEVVISALGLEVDRDKVGSASTYISGQSIVKSGEPTLINGLSGKSSGLIINRSSGDPGAGSYIQIRGQSSITGNLQPLIVVDGVPVYNSNLGGREVTQQSRLNDINPNDIESVEVLKGASASALWGTRAGNGVIMITTKKGSSSANKVNISYSGTYSIDRILTKHPYQRTYGQGTKGFYFTNVLGGSGYQFSFGDKISSRPGGDDITLANQGHFLTSEGKEVYPIAESDLLTSANGGKNSRDTFDPYDAIFSDGHTYDQTLSISGGNKDGNYYISVGDLNQQGIAKKNSNYRRTSFRVNTERQMNDWLKLSSTMMYSRVTSDRVQQGNNINAILLGGLRTSPDWNNGLGYEGSYYPPSGAAIINRQLAYRNQIGKRDDPGYDNPVWSMNNDKNSSEVDRFLGSIQLDITPIEWLTFTLRGGVDSYFDRRFGTSPVGTSGGSFLALFNTRETQYNIDGFVRGKFKLGTKIKLAALAGFNANQRSNELVGGFINTFLVTTRPPISFSNASSTNDTPFNGFDQRRSAAAYATADLDYKEELFLSLTGRAENSSAFSYKNNPTFFYPSSTLNWHLMKTLGVESQVVSFAKVRVGYGIVSTIPDPYNTVTYWDASVYNDGWGPQLQASGYGGGYEQSVTQGNKNLRPETKSELEGGFDIRFLQDRIRLGATYFTNQVKDVIIPVTLAASTGFTNKTANVGVIENKGIEIDFSGDILKAGHFTWNLYGNWTRIRNKIADLAGASVVLSNNTNAVAGYPLGVFYGSAYARTAEGGLVLNSNGFPTVAATARVAGDPNPDWRGGLGSRLAWKGLSLNILFEHSHGGSMFGGTRGALTFFGTHQDTDREVTLSAADAATKRNYDGVVSNFGYRPNADGSYTIRGYLHDFGGGPVLIDQAWWTSLGSTFTGGPLENFIEPAQWTKLREVSLTYSLNSTGFRKKSRLSSIDFTLTGRNLLLWTEFKGNDPESTSIGPANNRGRDYFTNPATKSVLFTIKINY